MPRAIDVTDPVDLFVGERLRAARLQSGLSQSDVGKAMGLSFQQVQKYERGTNRISASMLVRAATALGVPVSDLFPEDVTTLKADEIVDIRALRGGAALAESFHAMEPAKRAILIEVAKQFARPAR